MADGLPEGHVVLQDKSLKCLTIRDFTLALAKTLLEGGEVIIYKGINPYRYLNIRPIKIVRGDLLTEEYEERVREASLANTDKIIIK